MAKQNINSKEGFTIIEVVLVLAIAGLIFLMVFVALPSLQRSQRDTQRRNDLSRLGTSLTQWQTNHGTSVDNLPKASSYTGNSSPSCTGTSDDACILVRDYMNTSADGTVVNTFSDPDGAYYNVVVGSNLATTTNPGNLTSPSDVTAGSATLQWDATNKKYTLSNDSYKAHTIFIVPGGACDEDTVVPSERRRYAIIYRLEGSGTYCLDDQ